MSLPIYSRIVSDPKVLLFSQVQKLKAKTYFDESFMSRSRWDALMREAWIRSLIQGFALTPIILVDIKKCILECIEGTDDYKYFKDLLDEGYEWITCDGWNRNGTAGLWANDEVYLTKGIYDCRQGYQIQNSKKTYKSELKPEDRGMIDSIMVPVTYINKATRSQLGEVFGNVNKNSPQNAHEMRQALKTDLAQPIRDLATDLESYFVIRDDGKTSTKTGIFSHSDTSRRYVDEFILDCVMFVHTKFAKNWTASTRDYCYSKEEAGMTASFIMTSKLLKGIMKRGTTNLKKTVTIEDREMKTYSRSFRLHSPRSLFLLFVIRQAIGDSDNTIEDVNAIEFDKLVQELHLQFFNDSTTLLQTYEKDGKTPKKQFTYRSASLRNPEQVFWSMSLIMKKIGEIRPDLITSTDPERLYSPSQRIELWEKQGGVVGKSNAVCPVTNQEIPFNEVMNSERWQADHIIPFSKGGKTTIENGRLICALANKTKGNKEGYSLLENQEMT